jgi:hypothetical protein
MYRFPAAATATGFESSAFTAGPPSPLKPAVPVPATVRKVSNGIITMIAGNANQAGTRPKDAQVSVADWDTIWDEVSANAEFAAHENVESLKESGHALACTGF